MELSTDSSIYCVRSLESQGTSIVQSLKPLVKAKGLEKP